MTTFADIAFNAPFYRRLGFRQLGEGEIGPELRQVISDEADLERFGRRITMARTLARRRPISHNMTGGEASGGAEGPRLLDRSELPVQDRGVRVVM